LKKINKKDKIINMKILAIETSCDDTSISIIKVSGKKNPSFDILSNIVSSQVKIHRKWGGIYPALAKREHQKNLVPVLIKSLKKAKLLKRNLKKVEDGKFKILKKTLEREQNLYNKLKIFLKKYEKPKVDFIAVTMGPGLEPSLWVGVNFAKAISYFWNLEIIPVNHIEAHIQANFIGKSSKNLFPAISLVVSGGHTQLILTKGHGDYKIIGETRDDAAGECLDKIARILGLRYPGGPEIASKAEKYKGKNVVSLPRPMMHTKDYDFSFSGLKTAALYNFKKQPSKTKEYIRAVCFETQQAVIDVLIKKTIRAAKAFRVKTIILGGGVTANKELRKQFKAKIKKELPHSQFSIPDSKYCTDNAAMIGAAAYFHWPKDKISWRKIRARANLRL
tara:strand:- start:4129 stop:5304 length:1176 start_codon:yes stop_codon:yes gene_type:complete